MSENLPTKSQLDYLDMELGVFLHYGIRTFNEEHRDWDMKPMEPRTFNPTEQDCRKWISQLKDAGVRYTVLTSKHHDGFALWQTEQTEFSIKNTPYKNGKGDVIREYVDACREFGMFCGIYYSCSQFDTESRTGKEYDDFVVAQLTELLTNYGKIDYLWFDGCGSAGHKFDDERIVKTIRTLQPEIIVNGSWGDDIRWARNEWGVISLNNINRKDGKSGFYPGECDCCVVRNQWENFWFYNETHKDCIRTPEEILGMYYHSIGKGANLLINIGPDRRGLLPESNVALIKHMTTEMNRRLTQCRIPSSDVLSDKEKFFIRFDKYSLFDHVIIEEDISDGGHIKAFEICVSETTDDNVNIPIYRGFTVGHKMICTFPPIRGKNVIVKITDSDGNVKLNKLYACYVSGKQINQIY